MSRRGRVSAAATVASTARASTSAFITMPGPPPAGVSSTVRWRSVAKFRMSTVSRDQRPLPSALPARLWPSGPGNMSGKMVSTLARQGLIGTSPSFDQSIQLNASLFEQPLRRSDDDAATCDIDRRHGRDRKRHQYGFTFVGSFDFQQIAGSEILHGDHGPKFTS